MRYSKQVFLGIMVLLAISCTSETNDDETSKFIREVAIDQVEITGGLWNDRIRTNHSATIPHVYKKNEQTGRIENFRRAAADTGHFASNFPYDDTDIYKMIEGASYALMNEDDRELEQRMDSLIAIIAKAQQPDGYLYTLGQLKPMNTPDGAERKKWRWGDERWEKVYLHSHELYNAGHLIEAGVAYYQATGKRNLLNVAIKFADLISRTFGPAPDQKQTIPGHPEVELALVRLYEVTGEKKYLETADFFLGERGNQAYADPGNRYPPRYRQNYEPVKQMTEAWGHSVREAYMMSGMVDVGAQTADPEYLHAARQVWENIVNKKLYLIGGIGSSGDGEGFGKNYELPNADSYNESCAAIGNTYWNHRMFKVSGDAKYMDVLERSLYNNVLAGVSLDGKRFFYFNRLQSNGSLQRQEWFDVACCPGNLSRAIPSVPRYIYGIRGDTAYVNLYMQNKAHLHINGNDVAVQQQTNYPWQGDVKINVQPEEPEDFVLKIRIPGWARNQPVPGTLYHYSDTLAAEPSISVNGEDQSYTLDKGYVTLSRTWQPGDQIQLTLPMEVRKIMAHDSVEVDRHKFALERGPLVYTAESIDNGEDVLNLKLDKNSTFTSDFRPDLLGGITVIEGTAYHNNSPREFTAIPYYSWANRGSSKMQVWMNQADN